VNELMPIFQHRFEEEESEVNAVDARELHRRLEVRQKFSDWIKDRLKDFTQGIDYQAFTENTEKLGRPRTVYILTLETAKHIAMLERNEKGKEIRQYFINFEKNTKLYAEKMERFGIKCSAEKKAVEKIKARMELAEILKTPLSFAASQEIRIIKLETGIDYYPLLEKSELMRDIPQEDRMSTPTQLGEKIGRSGQYVNKILKKQDYQYKEGKEWLPTAKVPAGKVTRRLWNDKGMRYHLVWNTDWFLGVWKELGGKEKEDMPLFRECEL